MAVLWTAHRFAGGALALSTANSVVYGDDPGRRLDRFDDAAELPRFAAAASRHCAAEFAGQPIVASAADRPAVIALRDATDRLFRRQARDGRHDSADLAGLLAAAAIALGTTPVGFAGGKPCAALPLGAAMAVSALALLAPERLQRVRICPNCRWLFLDRSRNGSRLWCDMAVCGNRAKARRHYQRQAARAGEAAP